MVSSACNYTHVVYIAAWTLFVFADSPRSEEDFVALRFRAGALGPYGDAILAIGEYRSRWEGEPYSAGRHGRNGSHYIDQKSAASDRWETDFGVDR
jgi:hypothetical protein